MVGGNLEFYVQTVLETKAGMKFEKREGSMLSQDIFAACRIFFT